MIENARCSSPSSLTINIRKCTQGLDFSGGKRLRMRSSNLKAKRIQGAKIFCSRFQQVKSWKAFSSDFPISEAISEAKVQHASKLNSAKQCRFINSSARNFTTVRNASCATSKRARPPTERSLPLRNAANWHVKRCASCDRNATSVRLCLSATRCALRNAQALDCAHSLHPAVRALVSAIHTLAVLCCLVPCSLTATMLQRSDPSYYTRWCVAAVCDCLTSLLCASTRSPSDETSRAFSSHSTRPYKVQLTLVSALYFWH